jgi:hypothetical protein
MVKIYLFSPPLHPENSGAIPYSQSVKKKVSLAGPRWVASPSFPPPQLHERQNRQSTRRRLLPVFSLALSSAARVRVGRFGSKRLRAFTLHIELESSRRRLDGTDPVTVGRVGKSGRFVSFQDGEIQERFCLWSAHEDPVPEAAGEDAVCVYIPASEDTGRRRSDVRRKTR